MPITETTTTEIAQVLESRKSTLKPTVLFLGARTGGLFDNLTFYDYIKSFSNFFSIFDSLTIIDKFKKCHENIARLSEREIYDLLEVSLRSNQVRIQDTCLAGIVKARYFDLIISTNIDVLLESAFKLEGLIEPFDYNTFIPSIHDIDEFYKEVTNYCIIAKIFGELPSRSYKIAGNEFNLDQDQRLKKFMRSTLAKDILVIGYDPEWDQPIEQAFPLVGGDVLYVNEEPPAENSHIAQVIQHRRGKCLVGAEGSYRKFIQAIYSQLINSRPLSLEILNQVFLGPLNQILIQLQEIRDILNRQITPQELAPSEVSQVPPMPQEPVPYLVYSNKAQEPTSYLTKSENEKRTRVFISYSHRDERHLQRLHTHLASYERNRLVDVWDDKKIAAGADWRKEIRMALETTKVGVLLVSADFLASKFIAENELPPLLAAAKAGGVKIYSVILSPCVFEDSPLQQFQSVNEPSKPLIRMNQYEKEDIWAQVTRLIKNA